MAARWSGPASSLLDYILRVCQSLLHLSLSLGRLHWFLYLMLSSYFYDPSLFIYRGKRCWKGSMVTEMSSRASYFVYYIVWRVNLNKLSWNFVWALKTTTTNCWVSFIEFYSVFPTNFGIVFLPHTNTVILLERYCGTITEPGLPVHKRRWWGGTKKSPAWDAIANGTGEILLKLFWRDSPSRSNGWQFFRADSPSRYPREDNIFERIAWAVCYI